MLRKYMPFFERFDQNTHIVFENNWLKHKYYFYVILILFRKNFLLKLLFKGRILIYHWRLITMEERKIKFEELVKDILEYDPDGPNIHHLMAVHGYSRLIGQMEKIDSHTLFLTEAAAYLHDIGVKISREKFGNSNPNHQEEEGPLIARPLLEKHGFSTADIERICFIIGHHHSYQAIDGIDFQILVEADYLVNLMEGYCSRDSIPSMKKNVFKTDSGKYLLQQMFEKSLR